MCTMLYFIAIVIDYEKLLHLFSKVHLAMHHGMKSCQFQFLLWVKRLKTVKNQ